MGEKVFPVVTLTGNDAKIKMYPTFDADPEYYSIRMDDVKSGVVIARLKSYHECLETIQTIIMSFAALGYEIDTDLEDS